MKLFGRKKREDSPAFRRDMAKKIDGMSIKYVTERHDDSDTSGDSVIGRNGSLIVKDRELLVYSSSDIVFRAEIDRLSMSPLLSGEGIILEGNDTEHGGTHRKIIAYHTYYLKT